MSNQELSLFDAIRIAEATPESLAVDGEELRILRTKTPQTLKAIARVKDAFGITAKVGQ